jgi:hypothetical protein
MRQSPDEQNAFLEEVSQGPGNHSIMLNKLAIIPCKAKEATKLLNILRHRPSLNINNL